MAEGAATCRSGAGAADRLPKEKDQKLRPDVRAAVEAALRRSGALDPAAGELKDLRVVRRLRTDVSRLLFLELPAAMATLPRRIVLKSAIPGAPASRDATRNETRFYVRIAPRLEGASLARVLGHGLLGETLFLLLEDLSLQYASCSWSEPPAPAQCEAAVDLLAHIHALGRQRFAPPPMGKISSVQTVLAMLRDRCARFAEANGDGAGEDVRKVSQQVLSSAGRPWEPLTDPGNLTLTHGDAHAGNFLFPRAPDGQGAVLIDWQYWNLDLGVRDLAFFMALHWPAELRARLERPLLERYQQRLAEAGVRDYSLEACWRDYRLMVIRNLFVPASLWERGKPPEMWKPLLDNALNAFRDLDCAALL